MARKGEKAKARKSPDKSPRRVGRPPRRRKKSGSESSEDKKPVEPPTEVEQGESSESSRMRRSTRRQVEASTSDPKPQPTEWKEDESFWAKDDVDSSKVEERAREDEESATVWKVQTSNGSGGEIQKLRICRQRPGGTGSDSADSSMSPAKESSPLHKRTLKRESQKSPLVESVSEIELPPASESTDSSLPNQASGVDMPENEKMVQYVYETQPSIQSNETSPPPSQVNESGSPSSEAKEKTLPTIAEETPELLVPVEQTIELPHADPESKQSEDAEGAKSSENMPSRECQSQDSDKKEEETSKEVDEVKEIVIEQPATDVEKDISSTEKGQDIKQVDNSNPGESNTPKTETSVSVDMSSTNKPQGVDESNTETSEVVDDKPKTETSDVVNDESKTEVTSEIPKAEASASTADRVCSSQATSIETRRKSDSSVKSGGSRRSSVSLPASANSESNEPLLEILVNKSPIPDGKEEGEIVEDEKTETQDQKGKARILKFRTKSEEAIPGKIIINRRSTNDSTASDTSSKPGISSTATTAKKHPLITGPEPDDSPALRRRKLSALTTTRTVITPGGTTRQVRSIPGEALKAVLLPEAEKKDKDKRPKMIKIKDEKVESGGGDKSSTESKLNKVEDIREILKNNRAAEKKNIDREREMKSKKSPMISTSPPIETKAPARKVSLGAAPVIDEVKAIKPPLSKSPGDSKATPILFITNLVRPFTAGQLKELLARTGKIASNGFFIDKIKSKCFVKYIDVEMATETRHALNGVRWPVSNPKVLKVAYAYESEMKVIQDSAEGEVVDDISAPRASSGSGWLSSEQAVSKDKERRMVATPTTREWDRGKPKSGGDGDVIFVDEYKKEEKFRQATAGLDIDRNERHHDREKVIKEEHSRNHSQLEKDRDRDRRKRRSTPVDIENSPPPPARKFKKKDYDAPAKLLDDLFRKTKTSPYLYWLPLSAEQIAVKEETRRKQMAKHERKLAEYKKSEQQRRDKERDRDRERRRK